MGPVLPALHLDRDLGKLHNISYSHSFCSVNTDMCTSMLLPLFSDICPRVNLFAETEFNSGELVFRHWHSFLVISRECSENAKKLYPSLKSQRHGVIISLVIQKEV